MGFSGNEHSESPILICGVMHLSNNTSSVQAVYNMVKNQGDKASKDVLIKAQIAKTKDIGFGRDAVKISISQAAINLRNK